MSSYHLQEVVQLRARDFPISGGYKLGGFPIQEIVELQDLHTTALYLAVTASQTQLGIFRL